MADNFNYINNGVPFVLNTVNAFHTVLGPKPLQLISGMLNKVRAGFPRCLIPLTALALAPPSQPHTLTHAAHPHPTQIPNPHIRSRPAADRQHDPHMEPLHAQGLVQAARATHARARSSLPYPPQGVQHQPLCTCSSTMPGEV